MSNYKWVTYSKPGEDIESSRVSLCTADFAPLSFPTIDQISINELLENELRKNGIRCEFNADCDVPFYFLFPTSTKFASITAPLYRVVGTGQYEKVSESYTAKEIDPSQYQWIMEEFERCKKVVHQEQMEKFSKLFYENSLDGGLTAVIKVTNDFDASDALLEQYIPTDEFFKVCTVDPWYSPYKFSSVLFMKKMDAKGGVVTIKVPDDMKGLTIGNGGENIKRVARMINARRINVV